MPWSNQNGGGGWQGGGGGGNNRGPWGQGLPAAAISRPISMN